MAFKGTEKYIASRELQLAVNAAITLEKPLLIKGEPGTGKTMLAEELAKSLDANLIQWHIKSTTKAQQGLYEYDAVSRLRDSQLGDEKVHNIGNYIIKGKLWQAFDAEKRTILLIDEIDKADIEFPNDLLLELDKMEFFVFGVENIEAQPIFLRNSLLPFDHFCLEQNLSQNTQLNLFRIFKTRGVPFFYYSPLFRHT
jgi:MoxR-like ATPase